MTKVTGTWRTDPATKAVFEALTKEGAEVFFVGGCVRNALLAEPVGDIDLATNALPEEVIRLAGAAGLKAVPTGIEHGTVTIVAGGTPYEITTFRKDVKTDGRHATVSFSRDIREDAMRRDFTMNALYARLDGTLVDPLKGVADLQNRIVRFIGSAQERIREDYLRSLRYFRFYAWYGDPKNGHDPEALSAISSNLAGLERVSKERIGTEVLKLLSAPDPAGALATMRMTNVLALLLPGADDRFLAPLLHIEAKLALDSDPIRRLAILGGENPAVALRLSKANARRIETLRTQLSKGMGTAELGYRLGYDAAMDVYALTLATTGQEPVERDISLLKSGSKQRFPVKASDLMPQYQGRELGDRLKQLEENWIASDFTLSRQDLLR